MTLQAHEGALSGDYRQYHYDSLPPSGVGTTDVDVKNVLSVTF
ncbi:MAG: hypothetical protein ABI183_13800 [Polyangiaceae bacterium]